MTGERLFLLEHQKIGGSGEKSIFQQHFLQQTKEKELLQTQEIQCVYLKQKHHSSSFVYIIPLKLGLLLSSLEKHYYLGLQPAA